MSTATMIKGLILSAALSALASGAAAESWTLDAQASTLGFVSVKNGVVAEGHRFTGLSGEVGDGRARLAIDLASVDTGIEIRDQRMRDLFFQVAEFPRAVFEADAGAMAIDDLAVGASREMDLSGTLSIHGMDVPLETRLLVTRDAHGRVTVATTRPLVLSVDVLGLADGLAQLREIAGLAAITPMVPVAFTLAFVPAT